MRKFTKYPILASTSMNPRKGEYDQYLDWHIGNVQNAWNNMLKPAMKASSEFDPDLFGKVDVLVRDHDKSKYDDEEYINYCNYFYPTDKFPKNQKDFDEAWLRHIHLNPHHHQYWVLIRDEGELVPMDMPLEYICEMLCDWHSFSSKDSESTAYRWWKDNQKNMTLSDATINQIDKLVEYLQDPLPQVEV